MFEINHFVLTSIVPTLSNPCDLPTNAKLYVISLVFFFILAFMIPIPLPFFLYNLTVNYPFYH